MFKSDVPISEEKFKEMKSECFEIYLEALNKINRLNTKFGLIAFCFESSKGFLSISNKDDYKLYTEKIKNLSNAIQPILKHLHNK